MSGYEKAQLLELRLARVSAWAGFLAVIPVFRFWGVGYTIAVVVASIMAAACEGTAEKNLKEIAQMHGLPVS